MTSLKQFQFNMGIRTCGMLIAGFLLVGMRQACAQETPAFSGETATYTDELMLIMKPPADPSGQKTLADFIARWKTGGYNPQEQRRIIASSQVLARYNSGTSNHLAGYIYCLEAFKKKETDNNKLISWLESLEFLLASPKTALSSVSQYIGFSKLLIDSSFLYKSPSVIWKISTDDYRFDTGNTLMLRVGKTQLTCLAMRDSICISATEGIFYPLLTEWEGSKGTVTWERAGFRKEDVFAELEKYRIDMTGSEYTAEQAILTNRIYFDSRIAGRLRDKVKQNRNPEDADYPVFDTYQKDFAIEGLYEDIDYEGGLSMQGSKMIGSGSSLKPAQLKIYRKDTLMLTARSAYFAFKAGRIDAPTAEIVIRLRTDSIYHPGISLTYLLKGRELTLSATDKFTTRGPYFNSYHNIDMTFDQLIWKMDEPYMRFTALMGSTIGNATFESVNSFDETRYLSMQMMDETHPLISIRNFSRSLGSDEFLADDFASYLKKPVAQVKQLLMRMAVQGFIYYSAETGMATVKPRLNDYLAASVARIDYDGISFNSRTSAPLENAIFDLRNYNLTINGISQVTLSSQQNVTVTPEGSAITMTRNRDFTFDGLVQAGLFTFKGRDFIFKYDSFNIEMPRIDSLHIRYLTDEVDNFGFRKTANVNNLIQEVAGELFIDDPQNKSGRKNFSQYPYFNSREEGYVFYDDKSIRDGVYKADSFYFRIYPFTIDSLNNFNYKTMRFDGELVSAGIFPTLYESLRLHLDNSLGFINHQTPDTGLPAYGGKALFTDELNLSTNGLTGRGTLQYLGSTILSDEIVFYPDSVRAVADEFTLQASTEGPEFPDLQSASDTIRWLPYQDELLALQAGRGFNLFDSAAVLKGGVILKPGGLSGWGDIRLEGAELVSRLFAFTSHEILADTAEFLLRSLHSNGYTVLTDNMKAQVDFTSHNGVFRSNDDYTLVTFPENQYVSYLDLFVWDMEGKELVMGSAKGELSSGTDDEESFSGARYICLDPSQDSLSFISPAAYYDYDSNLIRANQVQFIDIADARIYPDRQELIVQPDARLRTLSKARIMLNRSSRYHSLFNATIQIEGRDRYKGSADYNYIDELNGSQVIHVSSLGTNAEKQSTGTGSISELDHFTLSPYYRYQGKFYLEADKRFLTFDGSFLIEQECEKLTPRWTRFRAEIDPQQVFIPLEDPPDDIDGQQVYKGLYMYYDSVHIYPAFLSARKFHSDRALATASGYLYYEKATQQYLIGSRDKILNSRNPGNLIRLNRETCELYGEGMIDMGEDLGQVILVTPGSISHNMNDNSTETDVIMGIDFYIPDNIINIMAQEMDSFPNLPASNINNETYTKGMTELIGKQAFDALKAELSLFGSTRQVPEALRHTLFLSELKLRWNNETNSWISVGKIGIGSINGTQINKRVNGLLELQIKRSGDIADLYLEVDRRTYYYFGYTRGVMQVYTSNAAMMDKMKSLKAKERKTRINRGESYIYMVSTDAKKNAFYRRYQEVTASDGTTREQ